MRHARTCAIFVWVMVLPLVASGQEQRAFLDLTVNGVEKGESLAIVRGSDVLLAVSALKGAGLQNVTGQRETVDGDEYVSLASLAPAVTFVFDERELRVAVTASPELLGRTVRNLHGAAPEGLVFSAAPSAYLNYALTASQQGQHELFTEGVVSARGVPVYYTTSISGRGTVRGLTSATFDQRPALRRWVVGDTFANAGALGGDSLIGGVTLSKEFSLAPYATHHPTLSMSTPVSAPSVVEVYVNDRLVRQEHVSPGQLDLQQLPLTTGYNNTRVVVRDAFGGTRELRAGYYMTTSALARGVHDYQYSLGWRRNEFGTRSFDYTSPVALMRHRVGLTDRVTAGWRAEAGNRLVSAGPSVQLRLPFGEFEASAGASRAAGISGAAGQAAYLYGGRSLSVGASIARLGSAYATTSLGPHDRREKTAFNVFASAPLGGGASLTVRQTLQSEIDGAGNRHYTSVMSSMRVHRAADIVTSVTRLVSRSGSSLEASIGLTIAFGQRTVAGISAVHDAEGTRAVAEVQRPLGIGSGWGYQLRTEQGTSESTSAQLQYQGSHGRYELRREGYGGSEYMVGSVSGAIVAIGGGVYATRAVRNSFALVRVPDVDGVRTFASHQEIGRTNRRGNLLIPDLMPYYGNELNIVDGDVPLDYLVSDVSATLAPPYRGGAVVTFPVRRIQRYSGSLRIVTSSGEQIPAYGQISLGGGADAPVSPLGDDGQFYFENLPVGRHTATITTSTGTCEFELEIPQSNEAAVDLGQLRCAN